MRVNSFQLIKFCCTWTNPAAKTKSIGLPTCAFRFDAQSQPTLELSYPPDRTIYHWITTWIGRSGGVFARHLGSFILTLNFTVIYQIRDFGSRQILSPRQLYLSSGLARPADRRSDGQKLRHTFLATGTAFRLKYQVWWPDGCVR